MTNAYDLSEEYQKQLRSFGFPENQIANRTERELMSMRDWAVHFSRQNNGNWKFETMGGGHIEENFFALARTERRS